MKTILTLTTGEFSMVSDVLSLAIAGMGAATLFFLLSRSQVKSRFQVVLLLAGVINLIGCYHSFRLFSSWNEAFELAGNSYAASGHPFHEVYRYGDWVLTMPLLLIELVLVLALRKNITRSLLRRLINACIAMVAFGYLGKMSSSGMLISWVWWMLEMIPFGYIVFLLCGELSLEVLKEPIGKQLEPLFLGARNLLLLSWFFYPLATLVTLCYSGIGSTGFVSIAVGATIADLLSKCGVGFYVYRMAIAPSDRD